MKLVNSPIENKLNNRILLFLNKICNNKKNKKNQKKNQKFNNKT